MTNKRTAGKMILATFAWLIVVTMALVALGHCSTTVKHPNSLGTVSYDRNPLMYEAVNHIVEASNVDGNLNLRVNAVGTYMLYSDDIILLCGIPTDKFTGVDEPFVLVYERQSHRSVQGVGCHTLINAYSIVPKKGLQ